MYSNTHEVHFRIDEVHDTKVEVYNMDFDTAICRAGDIVQSCYPDAKVEFKFAKEFDRSEEGDRLPKIMGYNGWNRY